MNRNGDDHWWCKPLLTAEGQASFWDNQAEIYDTADMTVDNQKEMDAVIKRCREIKFTELITLGGAVGCRDPKMIVEDMVAKGQKPPAIVFNDLSVRQLNRAREFTLKPFADTGVSIEYLPGEIKSVCEKIGSKPRRLIIGVYGCHSFFQASTDPSDGFPHCGFDEYLSNCNILGTDFLMEWVKLIDNNRLITCGLRSRVCTEDGMAERLWIKNTMNTVNTGYYGSMTALQIIGRHIGKEGFFLSHWYTKHGFLKLLEKVFPTDRFKIETEIIPKGMVYTIDPVGVKPEGVVTVLNNVIGNVLPDDQFETLVAIRGIVS